MFRDIRSIKSNIPLVFKTDENPVSRKLLLIPSTRLPFTIKNNTISIRAYKLIKLNVSLKVED